MESLQMSHCNQLEEVTFHGVSIIEILKCVEREEPCLHKQIIGIC